MSLPNSNRVTPITVQRKNDRVKFKPKRWSHQDDLTALKGKTIFLLTAIDPSAESEPVTLLDSDQFTIKVQLLGADKSIRTYFKHAVSGYEVAR